jgi:hypothetical protein
MISEQKRSNWDAVLFPRDCDTPPVLVKEGIVTIESAISKAKAAWNSLRRDAGVKWQDEWTYGVVPSGALRGVLICESANRE